MQAIGNATVSLGIPVTAPFLVPVEHRATPTCINSPFMAASGKSYCVTAMRFSTPHGSVFVDDVDGVDVSSLGAMLGTSARFPKGASIVFIQMLDKGNLKARLWLRGVGEAPFSPEAAGIAGMAAMMLQKILQSEANVIMGGHTFQVKWDRRTDNVTLTGPVELLQRV